MAGRWSRDCVLHVEESRRRSELKANRSSTSDLKTTCPKVGVVESLAHPREREREWEREREREKIFPFPKNLLCAIRAGLEIGQRSRLSPRIVLAHKEAVYQRLLLEAVTHAVHADTTSLPNLSIVTRKPRRATGSAYTAFYLSFPPNRGFLVVLLTQTSLRRVFSRRDSPSSSFRRAYNEIRSVTVKRSR